MRFAAEDGEEDEDEVDAAAAFGPPTAADRVFVKVTVTANVSPAKKDDCAGETVTRMPVSASIVVVVVVVLGFAYEAMTSEVLRSLNGTTRYTVVVVFVAVVFVAVAVVL
jgi:hypothetical protein